jgi:hypothetical protein
MSNTLEQQRYRAPSESDVAPSRTPWRVAGGLALAHAALIVVGIAMMSSPLFADGVEGIRTGYVEGNLGRTIAGGMVEALGFVLLLPVLVFLARAVGRRTEVGRWAAQTALAAGIAYVAVTMAVGFPAGAAAMYGAQNGLDVDTAFALNNVRIFAYFLSLSLLAAHAIGLAVAARQDGILTRWIGIGGLGTGAVLLVSVPLATVGLQDVGTLVWAIWWIGLAVSLLRHRPTAG